MTSVGTVPPGPVIDPSDPGFVADPYPAYAHVREATAVWNPDGQHLSYLTRFADVHAACWGLDEGYEVDGVPIPVGSRVALVLAAADRDPRGHPDPDRFDVAREDTTHLSLGGGIHFCIGAPLARLESVTTLTELARTEPELTIVPPAIRRPTFQFRGYDRLVIALAGEAS